MTQKQTYDLNAEAAVLGAILFDNMDYYRVAEVLRPDDFYAPAHQSIYTRIVVAIEGGKTADGITLSEYSDNDESIREVGGANYLFKLVDAACFGPEVRDYSKMIADYSARRAIIATGIEMQEAALSPREGETPQDMLTEARERIQRVEDMKLRASKWEDVKTTAKSVMDRVAHLVEHGKPGEVAGLSTGLADVDDMLGGMHPGDLIIIAGRPGMGKTALAMAIARAAAERGKIVGAHMMEMSEEQTVHRQTSSIAHLMGLGRIEYRDIRAARIDHTKLAILREAETHLPETLVVDYTPKLSVADIQTRARALRRRKGSIDLLVIDYLQIMKIVIGDNSNRTIAIGDATSDLKALAKELGVPIIVLSQVSRAVEQRDNKRPMLSDLRESGSIEQDADVVVFCYRDEYYLERTEPPHKPENKWNDWNLLHCEAKGKMEVIGGKVRQGKAGKAIVYFEAGTDTVADMEKKDFLLSVTDKGRTMF